MQTSGIFTHLNARRGALRGMRQIALVAGCCALVLTQGCGDDVTPTRMNTSIAGSWQVKCQPANEDCHDFAITFVEGGEVADTTLHGHRGPQRGTGEIVGAQLTFNLGFGTTYRYVGALDAAGNVATGKMTDLDYDGEQKTTPATLTRQ